MAKNYVTYKCLEMFGAGDSMRVSPVMVGSKEVNYKYIRENATEDTAFYLRELSGTDAKNIKFSPKCALVSFPAKRKTPVLEKFEILTEDIAETTSLWNVKWEE